MFWNRLQLVLVPGFQILGWLPHSFVCIQTFTRKTTLIDLGQSWLLGTFVPYVCLFQFCSLVEQKVNKTTHCGIGNSVATCEHVNHLYFLMSLCSFPLLYVWFCFFKIVIHLFSKLESQTVLLSYVFNEWSDVSPYPHSQIVKVLISQVYKCVQPYHQPIDRQLATTLTFIRVVKLHIVNKLIRG